ncbi:Multidrug efflux pump subunit AcrA (membrane-fusion protein) [Sporobacter termitidis DSM 10068]|uniref:Multidrug efflux pump subunit AcrA (Membrane-fusion protein) n=1 Tax=Sporobacter termitidis DSM 10068 TaxID=1123282 RepID=A0A1M5YT55_9FIRM|nr:HlyD family efflux transporter periplasmic adaptor subunit [Sporobacter termitidis]SHI15211.1 Multidrug efflux pump subunit AcrA (membrane-fusion protein) [Sporobacter termitidis DSM 10068]
MRNKPLEDTAGTAAENAGQAARKDEKRKTFFPGKNRSPGSKPFNKPKKLSAKKLLLIILILAVLGGGGFGIYRLFFYTEPVDIATGTTKRDSITTVITGTATVEPTSFQDLTIPVAGVVKDVYVKQGDKVSVGDQLFDIDTTSLTEDIATAESNIANYETQLATYQKNLSNLTVTAPFSGKLTAPTDALAGDTVNSGAKLATLVDDSRMKLALYFSNAYLDAIKKGMSAEVSVPQYMSTLTGTVTAIDNVSYVTSEGTVCFKATITVDNPGSLVKGLEATATVTADGQTISPADAGTLDYNQASDITAKVSGTLSKLNVQDSLKVSSGEVLAVITNDDYTNQINTLQKQITSANLKLTELQDQLAECAPTATVDGTVISVRIEAGDEVTAGTTAMAIYNTDQMKIVADISETDNDYITEGMTVTITKGTSTSSSSSSSAARMPSGTGARASSGAAAASPGAAAASPGAAAASPGAASASPSGAAGDTASPSPSGSSSTFTGKVTKKSLEATASNGVAYFETTIAIDSAGLLSPGIYVTYTITAAQASDVVLAPIAAIQRTTAGTCLFIKSDTKPDNAVELGDGVVPDGYYAVVVETGLTSNDYVEIKSGADEGMTVFERYIKQNTTSGSDKTSETSNNAAMPSGGQFPGGYSGGSFPGGGSGGFSGGPRGN